VTRATWVLASHNEGKRRELEELLGGEVRLLGLRDVGAQEEALGRAEVHQTYLENARAKAAAVAVSDLPVLADDSGIEVAGLGWGPGVHSAHFAGEGASDGENRTRLLEALSGKDGRARQARFVAYLVLRLPGGGELAAFGSVYGWIAEEPKGSQGFGYDPVFVPWGERRTVAELGWEWKHRHSHRAWAAFALLRAARAAGILPGER